MHKKFPPSPLAESITAPPPGGLVPVKQAEKPLVISAKKKIQPRAKVFTYVGQQGFLTRPATFSDKKLESAFLRCAPAEIVDVKQVGKTVYVYAKQNGFIYTISGLNRKNFAMNKQHKIALLDRYFTRDLSWAARGRQIANESQKVCSGQTWKDMPQEQFQFVIGDPELRRPINAAQGQFDVWTYTGAKHSLDRHYYFLSNHLASWTQ